MNTNQDEAEKGTTISVRVDSSLKKRLDSIAKRTQRSKSFLAGEAITEYLTVQEWQIDRVKRAMKSVAKLGAIPHKDVGNCSPPGCAQIFGCAVVWNVSQGMDESSA